MNKSTKKRVAIIYFLAFLSFGVGLYPTLSCINTLRADFDRAESSDPSIIALKEGLTQDAANIQATDLVTPICREREPFKDATPWFALGGILALAGLLPLLGKREEEIVEEKTRRPRRQPMSTKQMAAINVDGAFAIDIGEEESEGRDTDKNTLMSYVEKVRKITPANPVGDGPKTRHFVPSGFQNASVIFVDPELVKDSETHFSDLDRALVAAQSMMLTNPDGVQVKLAPGIYQTSIEVPPKVVIVNDALPNFATAREGLLWVSKQELDDPKRVTILAESNKNYCVKFMRGSHHGIFGCHIVGRGTQGQCGILIEKSQTVEIVNCVIEQFSNSGVRVYDAGSEFPKIRVQIVGSMIRKNQSPQGGGVFIEQSSLAIQSTIIKENSAHQGGGIFIRGVKRPIILDALRCEKNVASDPNKEQVGIERELEEWEKRAGMGGAIFGLRTKIKAKDLECIENLAEVGGGAIALLSTGMSINNAAHKSRIERNKSQLGGGIFVAGFSDKDALLKAEKTTIMSNICKAFGGAICILGKAIVQLEECKVEKNKSASASGGGISCHLGASIDINGGSVSENQAKANGGGIAALNGRIRIRGLAKIAHNRAQGSGGGVFAISEPSPITDLMLKKQLIKLPLKIIIGDAHIRYNKCEKVGSGLRIGNLRKTATMPLEVLIDGKASIRSNESLAGETSDIFASWAGEILSDNFEDYRKRLLK